MVADRALGTDGGGDGGDGSVPTVASAIVAVEALFAPKPASKIRRARARLASSIMELTMSDAMGRYTSPTGAPRTRLRIAVWCAR